MRPSRRPIIIAARQSPLARAQAQAVGQALGRLHPKASIDYRWVVSEADRMADVSLADVGGKGLFTRSVEQAVIDGQADLAVHSLKDLPADDTHTGMAMGLVLAAIPRRGDARDCIVSHQGHPNIEALSPGATLGTASPRRAAQVRRLRPDIQIQLIRGNVETRLNKVLENHECDATLLAVAGLARLGLMQHACYVIDPAIVLPAACQGALGIQCRADDAVTLKRCLPLNHAPTATAVNAERRIVAAMDGDCHSPIAVWVKPAVEDSVTTYHIQARVLTPDGQACVEADEVVPPPSLPRAVDRVIEYLHQAGAKRILSAHAHQTDL